MASPNLNFQKLPKDEWPIAMHIHGKLSSLDSYINSFGHALTLFDQCAWVNQQASGQRPSLTFEGDAIRRGWRLIAARDAAMGVYHFRTTLHAVCTNIKKTKVLSSLTNIAALDGAIDDFEKALPATKQLRHAVGHEADNTFSMETAKSNSVQFNDGSNLMLSAVLFDSVLQYTNKNSVVSLALTPETLEILKTTRDRTYQCVPIS